ncbi:hypothetical protein AKJ09_08394 [Labilithrix luteola]|uniref:Uncharacterized protein n=1 Tax=Labilithrix luteola TaxID=1391654 RepID=A0A0K1Q7F0_9BACT|nr:hypothetical protein AKJ09_08394 [Labilithrix luteola]
MLLSRAYIHRSLLDLTTFGLGTNRHEPYEVGSQWPLPSDDCRPEKFLLRTAFLPIRVTTRD